MKDNNLVYGMRPVIEAITAGRVIDKIIMQQGLKGELVPELRKAISENDIPFSMLRLKNLTALSAEIIRALSVFFHPSNFNRLRTCCFRYTKKVKFLSL